MTTTTSKPTIEEKVKKINELLLKGEPENISHDTYTGYSGYKPQHVIDTLNAVLGIGNWGFEEVQTHTVKEEITISQVNVWIENREYLVSGWGQSRITRGDIGDAKKGAQTDAIKKALSYFSIGNRAYHGLLETKQEKTTKKDTDCSHENQETRISKSEKNKGKKYVACSDCHKFIKWA